MPPDQPVSSLTVDESVQLHEEVTLRAAREH
jgi:hypothetical protein